MTDCNLTIAEVLAMWDRINRAVRPYVPHTSKGPGFNSWGPAEPKQSAEGERHGANSVSPAEEADAR
jgi:hypothetical protein